MKDMEIRFNDCIKAIISNKKVDNSNIDFLVNDKDEDNFLQDTLKKLDNDLNATEKLFQNGWNNNDKVKSIDSSNVSIRKLKKEIATIYLINKINERKNLLTDKNIYNDICRIKFIYYAIQREENLDRYDVASDNYKEIISCALARRDQIKNLVDVVRENVGDICKNKEKNKYIEVYELLQNVISYLQEQYNSQVEKTLSNYLGIESVIEYFKNSSLEKPLDDKDLNKKLENFALIYYEIMFGNLTNNQTYLHDRFKDTAEFNKTYISNRYYESMKGIVSYYNDSVADKNIADFIENYKSIFEVVSSSDKSLYSNVSKEFNNIFSHKEITSKRYAQELKDYFFTTWFSAKKYDLGNQLEKNRFKSFVAERYFEIARFVYNEIEIKKDIIDFCDNTCMSPQNYNDSSILNIKNLELAFKEKIDNVLSEEHKESNFCVKDIINKYFDGFMSMVTHEILNEYSKKTSEDIKHKQNAVKNSSFTPGFDAKQAMHSSIDYTLLDFKGNKSTKFVDVKESGAGRGGYIPESKDSSTSTLRNRRYK